MAQRTYDADKADSVINELTGLLSDALAATKSASADKDRLLAENELLKTASTPTQGVVAADARIKIDPLLVKQASAALVEAHLYAHGEIEKLASSLEEDPNTALHLVMVLAKDSIPPYSEGQGISKSAAISAVNEPVTTDKYRAAELEAHKRLKKFGA